jgi:uncharacterized damage-inducible protein DinB
MLMKNQLVDWFQWNNAANQSFINLFQNNTKAPKRSFEIFSHIINEHEIWLNRICTVDNPVVLSWEIENVNRFAFRNSIVHKITDTFLSSESYGQDFAWSFHYIDQRGLPVATNLKDVYFQILTYSEFHRGQLAKLLSENGIEPPVTDYFSFRNSLN